MSAISSATNAMSAMVSMASRAAPSSRDSDGDFDGSKPGEIEHGKTAQLASFGSVGTQINTTA
jgi:hypothetical protein